MADSPIADERDNDLVEMREFLWSIIRDPDTPKKDGIEASKLLARMHHALQVDRSVAKASEKDKLKKAMPKLKPAQEKKLQALLDGMESTRH